MSVMKAYFPRLPTELPKDPLEKRNLPMLKWILGIQKRASDDLVTTHSYRQHLLKGQFPLHAGTAFILFLSWSRTTMFSDNLNKVASALEKSKFRLPIGAST